MQRPDRETDLAAFFAMGVPLLRLHFINEHGACSCLKGNAQVCRNKPGKHPRTKNGVKDAIPRTDIAQLNNCNVGVQCGDLVVVLDVDPRSGGVEALAELEAEHGPLPLTWKVKTGGGGWHFYFSPPHPNYAGHKIAGNAVELKGAGGYVVAPSSNHELGEFYHWIVKPEDTPLAPLPEWISKIEFKEPEDRRQSGDGTSEVYSDNEVKEALESIDIESTSNDTWWRVGIALNYGGYPYEWFDTWSAKDTRPNQYKGEKATKREWNRHTKSNADPNKTKVTIGSLIRFAREGSWEPEPIDVEAERAAWGSFTEKKECEPTLSLPELKSKGNEDSLIDTRKTSCEDDAVGVISHIEEPIASDDQNDLFEDPNDVPYLYEIATSINVAAMTQNDEAAIDSAEVAVGALGQAHYATPIRHGNICTYSLIIGPSGCGKDSFLQAPAKIVKMFNPKIMLGVAQSAAAIRKEFYREPSRLFVKDEFANFLLRLGNKSDPLNACEGDYLELWSATTGHVLTGFSNKKDEDDSKEVVDGRCSIMGACTIAGLDEVMKKNSSFLSEGLGGRFRLCIFTGGKANSPFSHDGTLTLSPDIMRRLTLISIGGREEALVKRPMEIQATKGKDDKKKDNERGEIVTRTIYPVRSDVQFDGFLADQDGQRGEAAELYKKYHEKFRIDPNNTSRCTVSDSLMARVPDKALRLATKEAILANPTPGESRVTLPMMRFALARTIRQTRATIEAFTTTVGVADEVKIRTAILAYLKGKVSDKNPKGEMKWGSVVQSSRAMKPSPTVNSDMVARIRDRMQDEGLIVIIKGKSKNLELGFRVRLP